MGKTFALVALFVCMAGDTVKAQDVCYVDTVGSDAFNGLAPAFVDGANGPKGTIEACFAADFIADGDIISIEAGTYSETIVAADKGVFLEARGGDKVIFANAIIITADVTFRANTRDGFDDGVFRIAVGPSITAVNLSDGSLTVQDPVAEGRFQVVAGGEFRRDDDTSVSGTITYLGAPLVRYVDDDDSNTNVTAGPELPSEIGADGYLIVDIGGSNNNTLTYDSVTFSGGAGLRANENSTIAGTNVFSGSAIVEGAGNVGALDIDDGTVSIGSSLSVDDVDIANNDAITLDLNNFTVTINGSFNRDGGLLTNADGSTFAFIGGSDEIFDPGPSFAVGAVTVKKPRSTLDVKNTFSVGARDDLAFLVAAATTVNLSGSFVNVTSSGIAQVDGIILAESAGAARLPFGGLFFSGDDASLQGAGTYGNIFVGVGNGNKITVDSNASFAGTLSITSGQIDIIGANDLSPTNAGGVIPSVVVNLAGTNTLVTGRFNTDGNLFDLTLSGAINAGARTVGTEWDTDDVRNLLIDATAGSINAASRNTGTIAGTVTITGGATAPTVIFPEGVVSIVGMLMVGDNAVLAGGIPGGTQLTLQSSSLVEGMLLGDVTTTLGKGVTLTGSTNEAHEAGTGPIIVAAGSSAVISSIKFINGDLTTNAGSLLEISLSDEHDLAGDVTINGSTFTANSPLDIEGFVAVNAGTLTFGGDLEVEGDFIGAAGVTYAGAGTLVLYGGNKLFGTSGVSIPNVSIAEDIRVTQVSNVVIGNSLTDTDSGFIDMDGFDLTITGNVVTDGGEFVQGSDFSTLTFNNATITMHTANAQIRGGITIADGATLTLASADASQRTLTVEDANVTLSGTLALGSQILRINGGNLINDTGAISSGTNGLLTLDGGTALSPNQIEPGGSTLDILNLTIDGFSTVGVTTNGSVRITGDLTLNDTFTEASAADDFIVIGSLADLFVNVVNPFGTVNNAPGDPTFEGLYTLIYNAAQTTGNEVADNGELRFLRNSAALNVDQDVTVIFRFVIDGALTRATASDNVFLDEAELILLVDNANVPVNVLIASGGYRLTYLGPSDTISNAEFGLGGTVTRLNINPDTGETITLDKAR
ncbi:MAG: hypothetical protein WD275_02735, partial [Rhodothermales bacterium]